MAGILQIRRRHGTLNGALLALLGIWGGIIAFVGPYFHYAYTPDTAWTYNTGRLWLEILPGAATLLGGLILMAASTRPLAMFGAFLGIASGAWFALGNVFAPLWTTAAPAGVPASTTTVMRIVEQVGFFTGLGAAIILVAAFAAGRVTAVPGVTAAEPVAPLEPVEPVERVERVEPSEPAAEAGDDEAADGAVTGGRGLTRILRR